MSSDAQGRVDSVKVYSHNVYKNWDLLTVLLEDLKTLYDILFIQETP